MISVSNLQHYIKRPETLSKETLYEFRTLLTRYPYCETLRLLYLKNLYILHDATFGTELRRSALFIADRKVLFYLIENDKYTITSYPKKFSLSEEEVNNGIELDRTLSLIDAFLSTVPEENATANKIDYSADYTSYLLQETDEWHTGQEEVSDTPKLKGQELIDGFITNSETESSIKLKPLNEENEVEIKAPDISYSEENDEDSYFTETLAKIYIRQQRYSKALEIIRRLSLKYPKKNAYFADQIRFLEKLIINANSK